MTSYLIKNARLLGGDPTDILIQDGRVALDGDRDERGHEVIDATGLIALPGLVDLHTHLREPGREDAETVLTGTQAAAMGGYTAVHAMANTDPVADTPVSSSRCGGSGARAATATSTRSVPSPSASPANSSPSSARWPTRRRGCGSSPTTATA